MTKQEKNEVIEVLKGKFTQYNNFYVTDTESLTVAQISKLRGHCFDKQVEMRVAKNTLIKKALESLDSQKYAGVYDSLHRVTALLFSENPKEPALILSGFRKDSKGEKPQLKAAFINGDVFVGDNQLKALTQIKSKNELIGEVIGLLMSPIQRVLGALQNKDAAKEEETTGSVEATAPTAVAAAPVAEAAATPAAPTPAPVAEAAVTPPAPAAASAPAAEVTAPEAAAPVAAASAPAAAPVAEAAATPAAPTPAPVAEAAVTPPAPAAASAPAVEVTAPEAAAPVAAASAAAATPVAETAPVVEEAPAAENGTAPEAKAPTTE